MLGSGVRRWSLLRGLGVTGLLLAATVACGEVGDLASPNEEAALWILLDGERIDTLRMAVGESVDLDVENHLGQAISVTWSIPSSIATVSASGQVDAVEAGTARITAIWSALVTAGVTLIVE